MAITSAHSHAKTKHSLVYPPAAGASLAREHSVAQVMLQTWGQAVEHPSGDTLSLGQGPCSSHEAREGGIAFPIRTCAGKCKAPLSRLGVTPTFVLVMQTPVLTGGHIRS